MCASVEAFVFPLWCGGQGACVCNGRGVDPPNERLAAAGDVCL